MLKHSDKVALYMEGHLDSDYGKMGMGVMRYLPNPIVGVIDSQHAGKQMNAFMETSREVFIFSDLQAVLDRGADVLILGIAPSGGKIPKAWFPIIETALRAGLSIVNGLHDVLGPRFGHHIAADAKHWIWDVRIPAFEPPIASGKAVDLNNKRVLFVGTDMAVGKMTAGLEVYSWLQKQNIDTGFVATGQIGITITGAGIPLDAFKVDHACGAVETAVLEQSKKEVILIEGQGSLLHPGSTATLPLMRGSCPTHLILCHRAGKDHLRAPEHIKIPDLNAFIALNENLASVCGTYPDAKVVGICVNTSVLNKKAADDYIAAMHNHTGLPVTDVVRYGASLIGNALMV